MHPNLRTQLPWQNIKYYYKNEGPYIKFPSGKCNKIHMLGRKQELQIKNRNYITNNIICKNNNCETTSEIKVIKKNGVKICKHLSKKVRQNCSNT